MTTITIGWKQVADVIARLVAPMAVQSLQLRRDIGLVQVDAVEIKEPDGKHPAVRVQFEMADALGVLLNVKLAEFAADPIKYMQDLLNHLRDMEHSAKLRRAGRQAEINVVYEAMNHG
ncbi:hypothetical protein GCM10009091_49030 [Pseudomonas brenneri]|uniref:Uncharacterized protein n=1 Tax=Pseudomonas brenneri TaxID=129817 RepID=A0A5B2ULK8_9PSED|nr:MULTISPECIES: hypothetical protein [Pseudomonas fluorescens group]KAA2226745.1 hypothetical protein F1720_25055 [Pseudomonas brenneri]NVZ22646.1 hypothetical protein [Pseudomonas costantinii]TWR74852.1 hypothetical protein FJD34_25210 [Pseudomonas brenneri]SDU90755.1 hypothetical protein SAMN04490181_1356 [Pseudomonas brenneri]GGL61529.1 hypothetical protein GCM10009091_49030 [Pseudomonas brenneri]